MATVIVKNDPAKVKEFFEAKMTFTTAPVELERMMTDNEANVVDIRAVGDWPTGTFQGQSTCRKIGGNP